MPQVGLGCWKIPKDVVGNLVYEAIKSGVRHLDCACDYGNEVEVGHGVKRAIDEGIVTRADLWITSKLWNTYHAKEHVRMACEKSLSDMGVDYFDLYLIHFPICLKYVPFEVAYPPEWMFPGEGKIVQSPVPYHETWMAMEELVKAGLAKSVGTCNIMCQQLMDILSYCTITPAVNQVEMHPYLTQQSLVDYCKSVGIHITAFSPLGSSSYIELGMDGGKGTGALNEPVVKAVAAEVGRTAAQVVLRWGVQRGVSIIPKSSKAERIVENFSLFDFELSDAQMESITALNANQRFNDPGVFCVGMGGSIPIYG